MFGPSDGSKSDSDAMDYQGERKASGIVNYALETFEQMGGKIEVEVRKQTMKKRNWKPKTPKFYPYKYYF